MKSHYEIPGSLKTLLTLDFNQAESEAKLRYRDHMGATTEWRVTSLGHTEVRSWQFEGGLISYIPAQGAPRAREELLKLKAAWPPLTEQWYKRLDAALLNHN